MNETELPPPVPLTTIPSSLAIKSKQLLFSHCKILLGQKQVTVSETLGGGLCAIHSFLGIVESCTGSRVAKLLDNGLCVLSFVDERAKAVFVGGGSCCLSSSQSIQLVEINLASLTLSTMDMLWEGVKAAGRVMGQAAVETGTKGKLQTELVLIKREVENRKRLFGEELYTYVVRIQDVVEKWRKRSHIMWISARYVPSC
jgi:hypothetical protein